MSINLIIDKIGFTEKMMAVVKKTAVPFPWEVNGATFESIIFGR
jgi:hypothetical protein